MKKLIAGILLAVVALVAQNVMQRQGGTTTQVLHGNASGATSFSAVSLTADVSGVLPAANGGAGPVSWWAPFGLTGTQNAFTVSQSGGSNVDCWPFSIPTGMTINKIGFKTGATGLTSGQGISFAIFDNTGTSGAPGTKLIATTPLSGTQSSATAFSLATTAGYPIVPGSYYACVTADNASVTYIVLADSAAPANAIFNIVAAVGPNGYKCTNRATGTGASLAFPSTCGSASTQALVSWIALVFGN